MSPSLSVVADNDLKTQKPETVAERVQSLVQPIARPIPGEHATGAVGAMGRGRQADQDEAGPWIAEAGDGPAPVVPRTVLAPLLTRDSLTVLDQPRAAMAGDDAALERLQRR